MKKHLFFVILYLVGLSLWAQPVITSFTPAFGPVGTTVIIKGSGFNTTAANNVVFFGASRAQLTHVSDSSLTAVVPYGADFRCITVTDTTTGLKARSSRPFIVTFNGGGSFAPKVDDSVGAAPYGVTTGDFNGDGIPDLAVANSSDSTVSVLLNHGNGTFNNKVDYPVGSGATGVTMGDFNGDGKPDLAVTNAGKGTVSVLLGKGDGSFGPTEYYPAGTNPFSVTTGDFNGDGKTDLAVANVGSGNVSILLGNGDGTFASPVDYVVGKSPFCVTTGDFNGDGKTDLAVANVGSNTLSILLGNGDGTFMNKVDYTTGQAPYSVTSGDFNHDGKTDLAVVNYISGNVSVMSGNGDGTFATPVDYPTGSNPFSVTTGDLNGDGNLDLAIVNAGSNTVSVLIGKGDGTFATRMDFATGSSPFGVTTGNFNYDGKTDLAVVNNVSGTVSILNNFSPIPVISSFAPDSGPVGTSVTLSGSGFNPLANKNLVYFGATKAQVTAACDTSLTVTVPDGADFRSITVTGVSTGLTGYSDKPFLVTFIGGGSFAPKVDYPAGNTPTSFITGDFNGDGIPDLAVVDQGSDSLSVLLGKSDGSFAPRVNYAAGRKPNFITTGDFNGDGKPDLVVTDKASGYVSVFLGNGDGTFQTRRGFFANLNPKCVAVGDFNGDGKPDLAVTTSSKVLYSIFYIPEVSIFMGKGDGTFVPSLDYKMRSGSNSANDRYNVITGDFNKDGKTDLAVADSASQSVSIMLNEGYGIFSGQNYNMDENPSSITSGDFNGDGIPDLALANEASNNVSILLGKGDGTFAAQVDYPAGKSPVKITSGDFNGDGRTDLAVANLYSGKVSVLMGNGDGTFAPKVDYPAGVNPVDVFSGDFDHDGFTDLAVADSNKNTVSILRNFTPPPVITSFTPTRAGKGATITIAGLNFAGVTAVNFGGTPAASFTLMNDDTIQAVVGSGSSGKVSLTTPKGTADSAGFTFVVPPSDLIYKSSSIVTGYKVAIHNDSATVTGVVDRFSIHPDLPAGLNLDTITGVISGLPTEASATTDYTVFASNVAGNTTDTVTITVSKKQLMVTGTVTSNKVYDGTTVDSISGATLSGVITGDDVMLENDSTGTFARATVGTGISVTTAMTLGGKDSANYSLTQPTGLTANITAKPLTVSGTTAANKVYDGKTDAPLSGSFLLGVVPGDTVTLENDSTGTFVRATVGTGISVSTAMTLSGKDAGNYSLKQPSGLSADIAKKPLTVSGTIVASKVYDGTRTDTLSGAVLMGVIEGDVVTLENDTTGIFARTTVGTGISVTTAMTLSGKDTANYSLKQPAGLTADITPKQLTVAGAFAVNKVYDGKNDASISGATLQGVVAGDTVILINDTTGTFDQDGVGTGISVSTAMALSGKDTANYSLAQPAGLSADITAKKLTVNGAVAVNKVYDGKTDAKIIGAKLLGVLPGDVVSLGDNTSGTFEQKAAGTDIPVTAALTLVGADAGNYTVMQPQGLSATIAAAPLTITANNQTKVYDGSAFSGFTASYQGFVNGEDQSVLSGTLTFSGSATTATDAGAGYLITPGGLTSNNYKITFANGFLTIQKADQTIQFSALPEKQEGNNDFTVTATASSGLPVTFSSSDNSIASVQGSTVTLLAAGTCYINANQSGNKNYNPAPQVSQKLQVAPYVSGKRNQYLFTPNGDGINDYWRIPNLSQMGRVQVTVFDRWGNIVYQYSDYHNNWDGTYRGKPLPAGAYTCFIKSEKMGNMTGIINIVR